ncbi:MAG: cysteine desulfurase NifS [Candidatus Ancaeobacter aquaticus]|nr:cysteine desulfurase NifS [Candidatus Ancaeobacter aquaticus]
MKEIYVDNNATTRVADEVFEEMRPYFCTLYGNPSSMHSFGGQVHEKMEDARVKVADLIGAESPEEIIFTSCGTESDNSAILSMIESESEKKHIITTRVEHPAVWNLCQYLKTRGYRVTELGVDNEGMINIDELKASLTPDTAVVSVMYANNETGVVFPVEEIADIVKSRGIIFHTDAVQAVGKLPLNVSKTAIDMLSLSGHKLHAPKGVGALYVRKGVKFRPFVIGGHQEKSRRGGTENISSIIGLGKACVLAKSFIEDENTNVKNLRDKLENNLLEKCLDTRLNGHKINRLPNTTNISFEFVEGEAILLLLNEFGICASSGSACTSGSLEPSHVMRAMGVPFTFAHGSIRFSLSRYNNEKEIDFIIEKLPPIIERLREMSPYGRMKGDGRWTKEE